ncbi:hypothetical protein DICPUDRAFT_86906 [Dictyostelium purpureum]|uniref:PIN domain-containing protein n=1 Tax=Dictyostelium purpureum TaxID=5786 RepID=F0ZEN0_DICPU|nr:uncharacterized protein DICPUDRAFT_86906 [Dictyostelium purpureum]EGC37618.1 hypothetical protein DICPUDRAFT_86906 [Dictyostelium purpureum]|eukprot:XP_003285879.1 hypothetical protein DICPUDRAFT_86906 [Dictyostelium purpureum]
MARKPGLAPKKIPLQKLNSTNTNFSNRQKQLQRAEKEAEHKKKLEEIPEDNTSHMFFSYNEALAPPYHIIIDTNFINFSISHKLDIVQALMDCLYAKCIPYISDCVAAEIERLGTKFKVALKVTKDPRFQRLQCSHKGTYADDCIINRVTMHRMFMVATCDADLRRRIRKIPGVPIIYLKGKRYTVERMPELL